MKPFFFTGADGYQRQFLTLFDARDLCFETKSTRPSPLVQKLCRRLERVFIQELARVSAPALLKIEDCVDRVLFDELDLASLYRSVINGRPNDAQTLQLDLDQFKVLCDEVVVYFARVRYMRILYLEKVRAVGISAQNQLTRLATVKGIQSRKAQGQ